MKNSTKALELQIIKLMDLDIQSLEPKKELNPKFWKGDKNMLDREIRNQLIKIALSFKNEMAIDMKDIVDIIITGSIANYNWSKYSDIDLHILVDFNKINVDRDLLEDYFKAKKNLWNNLHDIKTHGHDVEVYIQDSNETHHSTGVYSLVEKKWLTEPSPETKTFDKNSVKEKTRDLMKLIDFIEDKLDEDPLHAMRISDLLQDRLKKMRTAGLEKDGEFSVENLTYKMLRRVGYLEKLYDIENKAYDILMSI